MSPIPNDMKNALALFERVHNKYEKLDATPFEFLHEEKLYRSDLHLIQAIAEEKGQTVTELGSYLGVTKGAVSQLVKKLEQRGLIIKHRNPEYGKELLLSLTEKGQQAYTTHEAEHMKINALLSEMLDGVQEDEITSFTHILSRIEAFLDSMNQKDQ